MIIFDRYMIKNLSIATLFVAVTLSVIIILTQSLRFLELVIESGASSSLFWLLTLLTLPRFLEVILPISLMAGVLFVYSRMISDSELIVMRASGASPLTLARPAIVLSLFFTLFLMVMTLWAAPKSLQTLQQMRQQIKAEYSNILFRPGIFNKVGSGLTVYIRAKSPSGELLGIMIHDSRNAEQNPSTILAKRGVLINTEDGQQVLVYDGSRQEYAPEKQILNRLNFERYTLDLPDATPARERWQEAEERTIFELLRPDLNNPSDVRNLDSFSLEIHKRILSPLLALLFTLIPCCVLLLGPFDRRGQGKRILLGVLCVTIIQGVYMSLFSMAQQSFMAQIAVYFLVAVPSMVCLFLLSGFGDSMRRQLFHTPEVAP